MTVAVADGLVARNVQLRTKDDSTVAMECEGTLHHFDSRLPLDQPRAPYPMATHSLLVDVGRLMLVIWLCDACAGRAQEAVPEVIHLTQLDHVNLAIAAIDDALASLGGESVDDPHRVVFEVALMALEQQRTALVRLRARIRDEQAVPA